MTHINKKGRPVSQCPHCRGLRRARASHVKCECGEKPHTKDDHHGNDVVQEHGPHGLPEVTALEFKGCCCSHGSRCTCALKKEHLDPVLELDHKERPPMLSRKPTLTSAHSENSLTVFKNHHHKPIHKHNHAAHDLGMPYKIPIPHSINGNSDLAHKSVDSLPLPRKLESLHSQLSESISSAQQEVRRVRSEHGSPEPGAVRYSELNGDLPPLDLSYPSYNSNINSTTSPLGDEYGYPPFEQYYSAADEAPLLSAGLSMPTTAWSAMDLPLDNGAMSGAYSQPPSYASFDHSNVGHPGLTTSSSDEISEVGDYMSSAMRQSQPASTPSDAAEVNPYRLSSASSYMSVPATSTLSNGNIENLDIDKFLENAKNTTTSPVSFDGTSYSEPIDPERFTKHGITVRDAQKLAHPGTQMPPTQAMGELSLPTPTEENDPLWGVPFTPEDTTFNTVRGTPNDCWSR